MPYLPGGANASILANFPPSTILSWIDGSDIPKQGPHTQVTKQFGCTINRDFEVAELRSKFKKGMTGTWLEERDGKVKIYIRGVTEYWAQHKKGVQPIWVENQWVSRSHIDKGQPWRQNINDWDYRMDLSKFELENPASTVKSSAPDTTVLGKTIAALIVEFHENPAPFMGTKIQSLIDKRATLNKGFDLATLTKIIVKGIKDAGIYNILNRNNFTIQDIINAATPRITTDLADSSGGGIYMRYHTSTTGVTLWEKNQKYLYVGQTIDYRNRFRSHPSSKSKYGDLTRNSSELIMAALCLMSDTDIIDFAYLVEQIFVCLLQTYRKDLLLGLTGLLKSEGAIEHVEAADAALYFRKVSERVFATTNFPGAVNRLGFGVSLGANYSMPCKEWSNTLEQNLFLRNDIRVKDPTTGDSIPIAVFRQAKPRIAKYAPKTRDANIKEMCAFQKYRAGKYFFGIKHVQTVLDGTAGPRQDDPYQLVFEIRKDRKAHPQAYSRTPTIGGFKNWEEGRSMAVRIEWEYPPKSGNWRHRYMYNHKTSTFQSNDQPGSLIGFVKAIAMMRWFFNSSAKDLQPWMPYLKGCAYVLQTTFNYHTQTIEVRPQSSFEMDNGAFRSEKDVIQDLVDLGLQQANGSFGGQGLPKRRKHCDACAMLSTKIRKGMGSNDCVQIPGRNCCRACMLFGRPRCTWTKNGAIRGMRAFSQGMIRGEIETEGTVTSEDVALNRKYRTALHSQILPDEGVQVKTFRQQLIDVVNLARQEDDLSDDEDAIEDLGGDDESDDEAEGEDDED